MRLKDHLPHTSSFPTVCHSCISIVYYELQYCNRETYICCPETREELKPRNLSFTEIAKRVGEKWQVLGPDAKEPFETQAARAKERYNAELGKYKKTDNYREYCRYLVEFKVKHSTLPPGEAVPVH